MAEDLGKNLLMQIEEVGFDEILESLRLREEVSPEYFGLPPLDRLLSTITETRPTSTKPRSTQPILELTSLAPGGKTHLLYYLTAAALLPTQYGGKHACTVIVDADGTFAVQRLAQQIQLLLRKQASTDLLEEAVDDMLLSALKHVHIFRPQTLASMTATLHSLPDYLFNAAKHHSFDRPVAFIALDFASAFYWQDRAEVENASLSSITGTAIQSSNQPSGYAPLYAALRSACAAFSCPAIFTTQHIGSIPAPQHGQQHEVRSLRPTLPAPFSQLPTLRLIFQRVPVRKFPAGISIDEARREAADRQKVVDEGKFECVVNEWGVDERTLQRLRRAGSRFQFKIKAEGFLLDDETASEEQ